MEPLEIRQHDAAAPARLEQEGRRLVGHAIVYNSDSRDLGGFVERFLPGSVSETITKGDIRALIDHNSALLLGRQSSGTLRLHEDATGLAVEIDLPDVSYARDLKTLMDRQDIRGMSFAFRPVAGGQTWKKEGGRNVREITKATLDEVSVVANPAYPATSAAIRALDRPAADLVDTYGVDLAALARIFVARKAGLAVSAEEQQLARQATRLLCPTIRHAALEAAAERAASLMLQ